MNELKQELEIDVHRVSFFLPLLISKLELQMKEPPEKPFDHFQFVLQVSVDELCKRFTSNVADGLTDDQVLFPSYNLSIFYYF